MGKLRAELEDSAWRYFHAPAERERIRSVLVDLSQTALAFTQITHKALEQLSSGIAPRLRQAIVPSLDLTSGSAVSRPDIHSDHPQGDEVCAARLPWLGVRLRVGVKAGPQTTHVLLLR